MYNFNSVVMKKQMEKAELNVNKRKILKNNSMTKLGYIFSKYDSFAQVEKVKFKNLFGQSIRPYGV